MKLIYRGVEYDTEQLRPAYTTPPVPYTLTYRGVNVSVDPSIPPTPEPAAAYELTYRGVTYEVVRNGQGAVSIFSSAKKPPSQALAISRSLRHKYAQKVHRDNLLSNLKRRLQVAQDKGDQHLIALLEAEMRQIMA